MINYSEYLKENTGKQVMISTLTGKVGGVLSGSISDEGGNIVALVVKQYLHRTEVPTEEILNVRLV